MQIPAKTPGELFSQQVRTLLKKDYSQAAGMSKNRFLSIILPLGESIRRVTEVGEGHIPFLICVPEKLVSLRKQMSLVRLNSKSGRSHLDFAMLRNADGVETPDVPYLIFDVEDGAAMKEISSRNCVEDFKNRGRLGLTAAEGVALVIHFREILLDHYIDLVGSRYSSGRVPDLRLNSGGYPRLSCGWPDKASPRWGCPSCGSRS